MSTILERLPAKFLRSQFSSVMALLCAVIEQHQDEVRHVGSKVGARKPVCSSVPIFVHRTGGHNVDLDLDCGVAGICDQASGGLP